MTTQAVTSLPIRCRFGDLTVVALEAEAEASKPVLNAEETFALRTSVEFLDTSAVALLALTPTIHVEFYAKPWGPGERIFLGETQMITAPDQPAYAPSLSLKSPAELGCTADGVYRLSALLRVGAEAGPALICAVQEDVLVQIHAPKPETSKDGKQKATKASQL